MLGYSAGGDGVYQMAPRMADRWAAAAMMAGHPNGVSLLSLRNVPFALQVGGNDSAYNRNKVGKEYGESSTSCKRTTRKATSISSRFTKAKPHWMGGEDKAALPWMAKHTRNPIPERVVWKQTGRRTTRSTGWPCRRRRRGGIRSSSRSGMGRPSRSPSAEKIDKLLIRLDDRMANLDEPIRVVQNGQELFAALRRAPSGAMVRTLAGRGDPRPGLRRGDRGQPERQVVATYRAQRAE